MRTCSFSSEAHLLFLCCNKNAVEIRISINPRQSTNQTRFDPGAFENIRQHGRLRHIFFYYRGRLESILVSRATPFWREWAGIETPVYSALGYVIMLMFLSPHLLMITLPLTSASTSASARLLVETSLKIFCQLQFY